MRGRRGAGEVIDLVALDLKGIDHIMADALEVRLTDQVENVVLRSGEVVIHTDNIITLFYEAVT